MKRRAKVIMPSKLPPTRSKSFLERPAWQILSALLVFVLGPLLLVVIGPHQQPDTIHKIFLKKAASKSSPTNSVTTIQPIARTDEGYKAFWANELQVLVEEQLINGKLPFTEINDRFNTLNKVIFEQTKKVLGINRVTAYHWASTNVEASAAIIPSDNSKRLEIYMPAVVDVYERLRASGGALWREAFQTHMIVLFMHEMEHAKENKVPTHINLNDESQAWADTCRYTIVPLIDHYNLQLYRNDWNMYQAWKLSNGTTNNVFWNTAIGKLYGDLDGKVQPER